MLRRRSHGCRSPPFAAVRLGVSTLSAVGNQRDLGAEGSLPLLGPSLVPRGKMGEETAHGGLVPEHEFAERIAVVPGQDPRDQIVIGLNHRGEPVGSSRAAERFLRFRYQSRPPTSWATPIRIGRIHHRSSPGGLILFTGPTGSGKTASMYASLASLNDGRRRINTIEDPIEHALEGVRQSQVNPQIDVGFSTLLRNVLRQSPDVVMVGEIRDKETAETAVRAANSGHLVLATIHSPIACSKTCTRQDSVASASTS